MNNSTQTYSINFDKIEFIDGDFVKGDDWFDMICEDGGFTNYFQYMTFNSNGVEILVEFELSVSGSVTRDSGDYYNPSSVDVDINEININVTVLHVDDCEVSLTEELEKLFQVEIKKNL